MTYDCFERALSVVVVFQSRAIGVPWTSRSIMVTVRLILEASESDMSRISMKSFCISMRDSSGRLPEEYKTRDSRRLASVFMSTKPRFAKA